MAIEVEGELIGTVHFRVDFEGLTRMVREYWAEGSYTLALSIMTDSGIPIDEAHDIIRGKRKMTQDPDGKNGVDGMIADDNWQPSGAVAYMGKYPDPLDNGWFRLIHRYGTEGLKQLRYDAEWAAEAMNASSYSLDKIRILEQVKHVPDEIYEYFDIPKPDTIHTGELRELPVDRLDTIDYSWTAAAAQLREERLKNAPAPMGVSVPGLPDVDEFIKRQIELDHMPKPEPDTTFSRPLGWIILTGKFYSCEWMEHDWLASKIGNSPNMDKTMAHNFGWIQITHPMNQPRNFQVIYGAKEPTQKQLDTLFDWEQVYGKAEVITDSGVW